jgi:subtilisin family serine protease
MLGGRSILLVGVLLALVAPAAAKPAKREPCPPGRFLVTTGAPLLPSGTTPDPEAVTLGSANTVAVASGCTAVAGRVKVKGKKTRVSARFPAGSCAGTTSKVRLVATIDASCASMRGKLVGKKLRSPFRASRSTCGDGTVDRDGLEVCEPSAPGCDATCGAGVGLDAAAETPLVDAVTAFHNALGVPDDEVEQEPGGRRVARTILEVGFAPGATAGQATALLDELGGRIVDMVPRVPVIVVRVLDPGSLAGLDALVARARAMPGVAFVNKGHFDEEELPANYDPSLFTPPESPFAKIGHHLGVRAHAAWNARGAIMTGSEPSMVVADRFGDGPPLDALAATVVPEDFATFPGSFFEHGYFVLGVFAGDFGGPTDDRGLVTGMFPAVESAEGLPIRVLDRAVSMTEPSAESRLVQLIVDVPGRIVVNTSFGRSSVCNGPGNSCIDPQEAAEKARAWVTKVRAAEIEGRYVHFTSAGNIDDDRPNVSSAATNSSAASAALLLPAAELLRNTVVVENARGDAPSFAARCVSDRSFVGGTLAGVGTDVWSVDGPDAAVGASFRFGTSYSTPQVAGLAAYLWSIAPDLTPEQIVGTLRETSRVLPEPDGPGCSVPAQAITDRRVIDAYDAVLSLDAAELPSPATAPVRLALMDVTGDGAFDAADLAPFVAKYLDSGQPIPEPTERDFGRFDLNGDGETGGTEAAPFDLDRVGSTRLGAPALGNLVLQKLVPDARTIFGAFDERALSDLDILCYYAHSALFTGTPAERTALLPFNLCNRWVFRQGFAGPLQPNTPVELAVLSGVLQRDGTSVDFRAGALIHLSPTNAIVAPVDGVTAEVVQGEPPAFLTTVTPTIENGTIEIDVEVRVVAGGPVIASGTISRTIGNPPPTSTTVTPTTSPPGTTMTTLCTFCTPPNVCCGFTCCF